MNVLNHKSSLSLPDVQRYIARPVIWGGAILLTLIGVANADPIEGQIIAEHSCAECHAVSGTAASPNAAAPPFRDVAAMPSTTKYSLQAFLHTSHSPMPNLILKPDDADDVIDYILSLKTRR